MSYFTRVQPYQHHTNIPNGDRVGVYSFALKPEEHQPSGTCNFSRIDNARLTLDFTNQQERSSFDTNETEVCYYACSSDSAGAGVVTGKLYVFAVNYNVLRIMSGMGGLAYSN